MNNRKINVFEKLLKTGFELREEENGGIIEDDDSWTTHQEELYFLTELEEQNDHVKLEQIGEAGNGMPIHLVTIGYSIPQSDEETFNEEYVFVQGGFHGNEPAGREAVFKLMRDLAFSEDQRIIHMLTESTFIFIPTLNPYGRENNVRRNIDDQDLNRDQIQLNAPESRAIAAVQKKYQPILFLDAHERVSGPNMSILGALNLNLDEEMVSLNDALLEDYLFPSLNAAGFTSDYYPGSGAPSNTRNMSSLKYAMVLLLESSRADIPSKRVQSHMVGMKSFKEYYMEKKEEIVAALEGAKKRNTEIGINRSRPFYVDGKIGELPDEDKILDPPPYGYLISKYHYEVATKTHFELFGIELEEKNNGYYISMAQPMMTLIPYLFDENASTRLFTGVAIDNLEEMDKVKFPKYPDKKVETTTFNELEAGKFPWNWKAYWHPSNWEVQDNPSRLVHYVDFNGERRLLTWQKPGEVYGDVEVAGLVHSDGTGSLFQIHLHGSGGVGTENSYYIDTRDDNIRINRLLGGHFTQLGSVKVDFDLNTNEWYNVILAKKGNSVKGKVWPYETNEPANWQIEMNDVYLKFGEVGVGHSVEKTTNNWAFFSVGTGGEMAERSPRDLIDKEVEIPNKMKLQTKIEYIVNENLENANLTKDSWMMMEGALNSARKLLKGSPTAKEINNKIDELDKAYINLQTDTLEYVTFFNEPLENSGWEDTWKTSNWSIKENPSRLIHDTLDTGGGRKLLSYKEIRQIYGNVEVSTVVKANEFNNTLFQLHLHSYGDRGTESSYYLDLRESGSIRINRNNNGTFKNLKTNSLPFPIEKDTWYNAVLRIEDNVLKGKAWIYGTEEPAEWQIEIEDTLHTKGYFGLGQVYDTAVNEYLFASFQTNGRDALRAPQNILIDKKLLVEKIAEIQSANLDEDKYTKESWHKLQAALRDAEKVLNNLEATQEEIDRTFNNLNEAYEGLEEKIEDKVNKEALQKKVDEINQEVLNEYQYIEESWKALQTALKIAEEILALDNKKTNQSIVDKVLSNLEIAYEELEEKEVVSNDDE